MDTTTGDNELLVDMGRRCPHPEAQPAGRRTR
jgi:hypothetical protein